MAVVTSRAFLGRVTRLGLACGGQTLTALTPAGQTAPDPGAEVRINWRPEDVHLMGPDA
jgi:putative spermidine/putrescine transport system ATP-binding protein